VRLAFLLSSLLSFLVLAMNDFFSQFCNLAIG
jgi:hypothetical protein